MSPDRAGTSTMAAGSVLSIQWIKALAKAVLPVGVKHRLRLGRWRLWPPIGGVRFGSFGRVTPISRLFGEDRGLPVDRYYIERFLGAHTADIRGRVLEVGDDAYTRRFGQGRVARADVLHAVEGNPKATLVADLTDPESVPFQAFDCIICTQTLHVIYDVRAALRTLFHALKPGGVLIVTLPGISQIARNDMDRWGDYWRFTTLSVRKLFAEVSPTWDPEVRAHGNVFAAVAFLHGLAAEELRPADLDYHDADYELLITVRARKPLERESA